MNKPSDSNIFDLNIEKASSTPKVTGKMLKKKASNQREENTIEHQCNQGQQKQTSLLDAAIIETLKTSKKSEEEPKEKDSNMLFC